MHIYGSPQVSAKTRTRAEVSTMFAELKVSEEQHMLEAGYYISSTPNNAEDKPWPPSPTQYGKNVHTRPLPAAWQELTLTLPEGALRCSYVAIVGEAGDQSSVGPIAKRVFGFVPPSADPWYYLLARCDADQDPSLDSWYFEHSGDNQLSFVNEGH